jgi:hypothetical protein
LNTFDKLHAFHLFFFTAEKASGQHKSWGDMVNEDDDDDVRTPGHAVHMHEKLSSPSRKRYYSSPSLIRSIP